MPRLPSAVAVALLSVALLGGVSGCAAAAPVAAPVSSPSSSPSPRPIEQVVPLDPEAPQLVQAARDLVAGTDGFAPGDARTALLAAADRLDADIQVVQLSMAGGPAASQATPPVDEALLAAHTAELLAAVGAVRDGVVTTAGQIVNVDAAQAEQPLRDAVFTAIQPVQTAAPTADTPRLLLELVQQARAAQTSQAAYLEEQARLAAEAAAAASSSSSGSSDYTGPLDPSAPLAPPTPPAWTREPLPFPIGTCLKPEGCG
ncbi:hypothetical protein [Herbiconiux sp. VKM Ac-2851]|uniref:hypothetical protein n=1 Tax=Herbiconiux sp. VKM Ac-2851 TaxID=2739025 RepID=UPI001566FC37|nr:hypothetical protein [Herbiconiux sp. VKM Ac-2851]NQX34982.1 hypothetical protein [Herbiconiux sp. VKM Ac-2851]